MLPVSPPNQEALPMEQHTSCFRVKKAQSTRENCSQCRWRKVRCDRRRGLPGGCGSCGSCERLGLDCSFKTVRSPGDDQESAKPTRIRGPRACTACREKKVRCSATLPHCINCRRRGLQCTYPSPKRPIQYQMDFIGDLTQEQEPPPTMNETIVDNSHHNTSDDFGALYLDLNQGDHAHRSPTTPQGDITTTTTSPGILVTGSMLTLVDTFFDTLYPLPSFAFIHPGTTKKQCREGRMHRALASAMCAIISLHLGRYRDNASRWIHEAEQCIWMRLENPSIPLLQALLLVVYYRMESGNFQRAFMLTANAARFASAMRLERARPGMDPVVAETRRRMLWSLKIIQRYFSVGIPEFELYPIKTASLGYPMTESTYGSEKAGERGSYSLHSRLEVARKEIMRLTRELSSSERPIGSVKELMKPHEETLTAIGASMPDGGPLLPSQVCQLLSNPWFSRHLAAQVSWHQAHCDLYRILVPGYPEAAPASLLELETYDTILHAEKQCLEHASSTIQILTAVNQESMSRHFLEFDVAICAYHATRLLLFISRFGKSHQRPTPEFAASRAELCVVALKRFFPNSVLVAPMVEEMQNSIGIFSQQNNQSTSPAAQPTPADSRQGRNSTESRPTEEGSTRQRLAIHSLLRQTEFLDGDASTTPPSDLASAEELNQQLPTQGDQPTTERPPLLTPGNDVMSGADHPSPAAAVTACPPAQPPMFSPREDTRDWNYDSFGEVYHPFFSMCGPDDWGWLFDNDQIQR